MEKRDIVMEVQKLVVRGIQLGSSGLANSAQLGSARPAPMQHRQGSLSNLFRDYSRLPLPQTGYSMERLTSPVLTLKCLTAFQTLSFWYLGIFFLNSQKTNCK